MERKYRIKANVGKDSVLNVDFRQDIDLYEILSLDISKDKIDGLRRENTYKKFSSDYGVIVGRVLANDAFGVPNAKVSVFLPLTDEDSLRTDIKNIYPYSFVTDYNDDNIRFNTLPINSVGECYTPVGTFPDKRLVLDNDTILEIYDKYYKYTTVTNNAGDYMIFGVPVGEQIIHTDIDLSDIGVLSQSPYDFLSKGYTIDMFESATKFKKSTNLDNLAQIFSDNTSVNVYPLWGDKDVNEIAITRKDIRLQYKFETTCVFLGSIITDSPNNSISYTCEPDLKMGKAGQLVTSEGTIEMIRKTVDDVVEEYSINGNRLIDGDGVFCYQIPMNLDFVQTDEYGNIVPTDNPTKGIATRARVRFRFTLTESGSEALTTHKARYLVPNNPDLDDSSIIPRVSSDVVAKDSDYYKFGTDTPDECFRDLYWNKVYSIKGYIPRVQKSDSDREQHYLALKSINNKEAGNINPLPFNRLNLNMTITASHVLHQLMNADDEKSPIKVFWNYLRGNYRPFELDAVYETIIDELDGYGLDFYNDWLNGCLYFPNWYWYLEKRNDVNKNSKEFKTDKEKYNSLLCECKGEANSNTSNTLYVVNNCSLFYENVDLVINERPMGENADDENRIYRRFINSATSGSPEIQSGIIKKEENSDKGEIYYYAFGDKIASASTNKGGLRGGTRATSTSLSFTYAGDIGEVVEYARLFSTDLILLGSLKDNDIHSIPKIKDNIPITTSHIPTLGEYKYTSGGYDSSFESAYNGMNWGGYWFKDGPLEEMSPTDKMYGSDGHYKLGSGLFFGLTKLDGGDGLFERIHNWAELISKGFPFKEITPWKDYIIPYTDFKTGPNAERISELGVTLDSDLNIQNTGCRNSYVTKDGLITSKEIVDEESRSFFASLNSNKLIGYPYNLVNGYNTYSLCYLYPNNFDGRLYAIAHEYTFVQEELTSDTEDYKNKDYLDFRFGTTFKTKRHFYSYIEGTGYLFPLYENSFYFYFGLNPGRTAIEKFYSNYIGKCVDETENYVFNFTAKGSEISPCKSEGIIDVKIENMNAMGLPYTITLLSPTGKELEVRTSEKETETFKGLAAGKYTIKVVDLYENSVIKTAEVTTVSLSINVETKQIGISYDETSKDIICSQEYYGQLIIKSYSIGSSINNITSIPTLNTDDSKKYYFDYDNKVTIYIESQSNEDLSECLCQNESGKPIIDGNSIRVKKPNSYIISIVQKGCDTSYTSVSKTVSDGKFIEMNIGGIDLKNMINENDITSKTIFYDPTKTSDNDYTVSDVRGWFGVHNPSVYSSSFNGEITSGVIQGVNNRLKQLFSISKSTYVESNENNNKLNIEVTGDSVLLRLSHPVYENTSWDNEDDYITENNNYAITANNKYPNIVSSNYVYGNNLTVTGDYEFNRKYRNASSVTHAGNYFACFGNNAAININNGGCYRNDDYEEFDKIPAKADDLFEYSEGVTFCTSTSDAKNEMSSKVYVRTNENTKPYFRTEFIDRRLDYDLLFITPTKFGDSIDTWNSARLSGNTFNGIEMAYTDTNKNIVSKNDNTEYTYDENTGVITLTNGKKRFYDSKIKVGDNNSYQIEDLYYSNVSNPVSNSDIIDVIHHDNDDFSDQKYKNFGIENDNIVGYPTKRLIDLNIKEHADKFTYSVTSCSYDIPVVTTESTAKEGETVSYIFSNLGKIFDDVEAPGIACNDLNGSGTIVPSNFDAYIYASFLSEAYENGYKYKILYDDENHIEYNNLKTATTLNLNDGFVDFPEPTGGDNYNMVIGPSIGNKKYVGFLVKKVVEGDENNLTKKVTFIDATQFFEIKRFTCTVTKSITTNNSRTSIPSTDVNTEGTGDITIDGQTYTVHVTSRGSTDATEGNTAVNGVKIRVEFSSDADIKDVKCDIFGTMSSYTSREEDRIYTFSTNIENPETITKITIYAKNGDGLLYYFDVNLNN